MAGMADAVYRTEVFAVGEQRPITSPTGRQRADVFARRERRQTAATTPRLHRIALQMSIGDDAIELVYSSPDRNLPAWADAALQSLSERWGVQPGWDSYSAVPTSRQAVIKLLNVLSGILDNESPGPLMTPLADGGIQAEWHLAEQDVEIVMPAADEATYYYFNRQTGEEREADLTSNWEQVQNLVKRLGR